jgi:hypothetical protein
VVAAIAAGALLLGGGAYALTPTDPDAGHWAYAALDLQAAWDVTTGSPEVAIAVVDSGVDPAHPELAGAVLPGYDFVADRPGASPVDGHGTGVAGTAAGRAGNGLGGIGACPRCSVLPLQVVGAGGIALNEHIAQAIDYAVDHGAAVVNISLIGPNFPPELERAVTRARAAGLVVVAAAGNDATDAPRSPAAVPGVLSVGAVTPEGRQASFSNHGSWVKVAAPECAPIAVLGGGTGVGCGTSMSAPLVAGVVALERTLAPFASPNELEAWLFRTARATPGSVFGVPDAEAALGLVRDRAPRLQVAVLGSAAAGVELEAFSGIWVGAGLPTAFQWERCRSGLCVPIAGATSSRYLLTRADGGSRIRAVATIADVGSAASPMTGVVATAPRVLGRPTIRGPARVGARLVATRGRWEGWGLRFSTTWLRCRGACTAVASGRTYRPRARDRGYRLRVEVEAVNALGSASARSRPTAGVRSG